MASTPVVEEIRTFDVPEENLHELREKLARIARRANRIHVTPPTIVVDPTPDARRIRQTFDDGQERTVIRKYHKVTLTGETPKLPGGWELAAVLTRVEGGNLIASTGKHEIPKTFRDTEPLCEHCNLDRRRNETFLVVNEAGEWKQVGRNCLGDFLGAFGTDPNRLLAMMEMIASAISAGLGAEDESLGGGGGHETAWALDDIVSTAVAVIAKTGFVSKARAEETNRESTSSLVWTNMRGSARDRQELKKRNLLVDVTDADRKTAEDVIAWAAANKGESDFDHNTRLLAKHGFADRRTFGIAVYLAAGYDRAQRAEEEARAPKPISEFFGTIDKRETFTLCVVSKKEMVGDYGTTTLIIFHDPAGNVGKWFGSGEQPAYEIGKTYKVKATVKSHEDWRGTKQTSLSRVTNADAAHRGRCMGAACYLCEEAAKKEAEKAKTEEWKALAIAEGRPTYKAYYEADPRKKIFEGLPVEAFERNDPNSHEIVKWGDAGGMWPAKQEKKELGGIHYGKGVYGEEILPGTLDRTDGGDRFEKARLFDYQGRIVVIEREPARAPRRARAPRTPRANPTQHKVVRIELIRAEGPVSATETRTTATSFSGAQRVIRRWAAAAPPVGYEKVDFKLTFEDGNTYSGRLDVRQGHDNDLARHIRHHAEHRIAKGDKKFIEFLRDYEIDDEDLRDNPSDGGIGVVPVLALAGAAGAAWWFLSKPAEPPLLTPGAPRVQPRPFSVLNLLTTSVWDTTANQLHALGYTVVARDPISLAQNSRLFAEQHGLTGDNTRVEVVLAIDDAYRARFGVS